jgi:sporulation protein YlmC with PRC-barrel domain
MPHTPLKKTWRITALLAGSLGAIGTASAQVAGSTTVGISVTEATQVALGWSVKKSILGKTLVNEAGEKIGKIEDLIISPDRSVSYLIVGAGGFIGMGRHNVAIPVSQIQETGGKIVMPGATKAVVAALPEFRYVKDTARRDLFVATVQQDIARANTRLLDLQARSAQSTAEAKARLDLQITGLQLDLKATESKLAEMQRASATLWKEFESDLNAATARLRKWLDTTTR